MKRALCLALLIALGGCSRARSEQDPRCNEFDAGMPVDPLLLAFLSRARAAHHLADNHEANADLTAAIAPLAGLVTGPLPVTSSAELAPEVREVLADTRARLADLRSRQGAFEPALADVRAGLELVRDPNYFKGHLLETEGLVEERHAKALEKSDPAAADALRKRAIGLLEQAMAVQSEVIQKARRAAQPPSASREFPAASALPTPSPSPTAAPPR
ncbi:MAG: hypothetical protein ABIQ16_09870 [Polyangiaceae bacterium]